MRAARRLAAEAESWPIAGGFTISRGTKTAADVVVATISDGAHTGRGECVPYPRYGESVAGVIDQIAGIADAIDGGLDRDGLRGAMPPGAARNAVDCALWDLEAKRAGRRAWQLAGLDAFHPIVTAYTLSLGSAESMAAAAARAAHRPLLKLKLGGDGDAERIAAVREAAPGARLIVDANEGWRPAELAPLVEACAAAAVELIEQPLPADDDAVLAGFSSPVPICADESAHALADLDAVLGKYGAINIKLDKTGGLTEALLLADAAAAHGLKIVVGCMLATSLAMAPAAVLAQNADIVDLDGPLLLARDRAPAIAYEGSLMQAPAAGLWG